MRNIKVRVYKSSAKLKKEEQLAWKIAEIASDQAPLNENAIDTVSYTHLTLPTKRIV